MHPAAKFPLGRLAATPGALEAMEASGQALDFFLARHQAGDWGEVGEEDQRLNDQALSRRSQQHPSAGHAPAGLIPIHLARQDHPADWRLNLPGSRPRVRLGYLFVPQPVSYRLPGADRSVPSPPRPPTDSPSGASCLPRNVCRVCGPCLREIGGASGTTPTLAHRPRRRPMPAKAKRLLTATALLLAAACALTLPGSARAAERNEIISRGVYDGAWHGGKVVFSVERVDRDGCFSGTVHFDARSPWPDAKFDFAGQIGRGGALTVRRVKDGWNQVARTGVPQINGSCWVWKGQVSGDGLAAPAPFELHVPR
jgi:hypothetical protein